MTSFAQIYLLHVVILLYFLVSLQIKFNLIDSIRRGFVVVVRPELNWGHPHSVQYQAQEFYLGNTALFFRQIQQNPDQKIDSRAFGGGVEAEKDCDKERGENI